MLPVYRVRCALSGQEREGVWVPSIQAIAAVVARDRGAVPGVLVAACPDWAGAALAILEEWAGAETLWAVRVGTGEPRRYFVVAASTEAGVGPALLALLPPDDPWRQQVTDGWFSVQPVDRTKEGVF